MPCTLTCLARETSYTYDAAGRRLTLTDPEENTTTWVYDDLGRVVEETNALSKTREFKYDPGGNLLRRVDREGRVRDFAYANLGRTVAEYWYATETAANADTTRTAADETFSYTFDTAGQLLTGYHRRLLRSR